MICGVRQALTRIGNSSIGFTGKFDGLNHTISNLNINRPNQDYVGLFRTTGDPTIQNIGLIPANVQGSWRVGALIGEANYTNTSNAFSTGLVNGYRIVGGLVGFNQNRQIFYRAIPMLKLQRQPVLQVDFQE